MHSLNEAKIRCVEVRSLWMCIVSCLMSGFLWADTVDASDSDTMPPLSVGVGPTRRRRSNAITISVSAARARCGV